MPAEAGRGEGGRLQGSKTGGRRPSGTASTAEPIVAGVPWRQRRRRDVAPLAVRGCSGGAAQERGAGGVEDGVSAALAGAAAAGAAGGGDRRSGDAGPQDEQEGQSGRRWCSSSLASA